jgi:hypothetical protein
MSTRPANSTLAEVPLQTECRSESHDLARGCCLSCLERRTGYRQAVGHLPSRAASGAAQGGMALIRSGDGVLPIASARFEADCSEAIGAGCQWRGGYPA